MDPQKSKNTAAAISVVSNTGLVLLKFAAGVLSGSLSLISEAIHSGVDLIAALVAWYAVRAAARPPDRRHPYGHGKIENISGTLEAILIFVAAGIIIAEAVHKLIEPAALSHLGWGLAVMIFSALVNFAVSQWLFRVAEATDSVALKADAWHLRTDVYTSVGVCVSLGLIIAAGHLWPEKNFVWIDPACAIIVALLIVRAAYDLWREAAGDILDVSLPAAEVEKIQECLRAQAPAVRGFHDLRTRKAGAQRFVEMHILVERHLNIEEAHKLTHRIRDLIKAQLAETTVIIHVEPCDERCLGQCASHCFIPLAERAPPT
ncbi:MAG: cation diffusion facilitator family transporter [Planctomycetota bacterium]|nr:cation diffusion facilitator family transporter [Planctomycetota bacterium]